MSKIDVQAGEHFVVCDGTTWFVSGTSPDVIHLMDATGHEVPFPRSTVENEARFARVHEIMQWDLIRYGRV